MPPETLLSDAYSGDETSVFPDDSRAGDALHISYDPNGPCTIVPGEDYDFQKDGLKRVEIGADCPSKYLPPPTCEAPKIEVPSTLTHEGILFVINDPTDPDGPEIFDLQSGRMAFNAEGGVCQSLPKDKVGVQDVRLEPLDDPTELLTRTEVDKGGEDLIRLHVFKGTVDVSKDGIHIEPPLGKGEQVLFEADSLTVREAFCVDKPKAEIDIALPVQQPAKPVAVPIEQYQEEHQMPQAKSYEGADGGCNVPNHSPHAPSLGEMITLGAPVLIMLGRKQIGRVVNGIIEIFA